MIFTGEGGKKIFTGSGGVVYLLYLVAIPISCSVCGVVEGGV